MNKITPGFFRQSRVRQVAKFGFIYLMFLALSWRRLDPDFGWHLKSGEYYLHHGIPAHDIYTYTARGFAWINHEWGNDILLSLLYSIGGYSLASLFYAGLWTAAFYIKAFKVRLVFLLVAVAAVLPYAGVRPIAWTFLFFAVLLRLLESKKPPSFYLIAILFAAWANFHGGFVIGLAVIFYYLCKTRKAYFAWLLAVSIIATFINPYGPFIYVEIGRTLIDSQLHNQITEWNSFLLFNMSFAFIGIWWTGFILYKRRPLQNWLGLGPWLFAASLTATRNVPLFVIATVSDVENYYRNFRLEAPKKLNLAAKVILASCTVLLIGYVGYVSYGSLLFWQNRESTYPLQQVAYLKSHPCSGHLFNDYNFGGYLIWKLPNTPLYIDGRMSSWRDGNGQKYLTRYLNLFKNDSLREKEFDRYQIKCVLVKTSNAKFISSLKEDKWTEKVSSGNAVLLEK